MERADRKVRQGKVVSAKCNKTIVVAIETFTKDKLYGKRHLNTKKYFAHDEENTCGVGDTVRIMETRPLSKTKRWRLLEIVEKAK
ncbi:MAG: 30S ribosomal protein S17 [Eubacteriaceae bacterium]|nr:30S ribosomal protein S17 [Eubacteriaceae bacterium]